jgi:hypothetical protein
MTTMNLRPSLRLLTIGAVASGSLAGVFAGAAAAEEPRRPHDVDGAKAKCIAAIDRRFTAIDEFQAAAAGSRALTDAHESALNDELAGAESGLTTLRASIEAATTADELRDLCPKIVTDYRVFVLEGPTVRLTIGSDTGVAGVQKLREIADRLDAAIAAAQAAGKDVGDAPAKLADLRTQVDTAESLAAPVADTVLPLTPADYNAGTAGPVLEDARNDLRSAKDSLHAAGEDARAIVAILRSLRS